MYFTAGSIGFAAAVAVLLALLPGCATFTNGTRQAIAINTVPSGAIVEVGGESYQTPCAPELKRKHGHTLVISKEGYRTETQQLAAQPTRATHGNFWLGGIIGLIVDAITGADNKLVPECFNLVLVPDPAKPEDQEARAVSASEMARR